MCIEQQFEVLCIHLSIAVKNSMDPSFLLELLRDGPRLSNANRSAHTQPLRAEDDSLPLSQGPCCLSRSAIHGSIVDHDDAIDPSWDRFDHIDDAGGLIACWDGHGDPNVTPHVITAWNTVMRLRFDPHLHSLSEWRVGRAQSGHPRL